MRLVFWIRPSVLALLAGACAAGTVDQEPIPVQVAEGRPRISVVYPPADAVLPPVDSAFLFGSVGTAYAALDVDGREVRVWPNGSWLAWVALPDDTVAAFRFSARDGSDVDTLTYILRIARGVAETCSACAWVDTTSFAPRGHIVVPVDEVVQAEVRAAPDAEVRLLLPWGDTIRFRPDRRFEEPNWGVRAFALDSLAGLRRPSTDRYVAELKPTDAADVPLRGEGSEPPAELSGVTLATESWSPADPRSSSLFALPNDVEAWPDPILEVIRDDDTTRAAWPLMLQPAPDQPVLVMLHDDTGGTGEGTGLVNGRATPGGTYHWFFPNRTVAGADARWNGLVRLRLSQRSVAWVPADELRPLRLGAPATATVGSIRVTPDDGRLLVRIPVSERIPTRVDEDGRTLRLRLYGAVGDPDWIQYGPADPLIDVIEWSQETEDEVVVELRLTRAVWGYRTRWRGRELVLEVHRPPNVDARAPLRGRVIALDPGHPPVGSTGPSGQREPDVTLGVAEYAKAALERRGARVVMTRTDDQPVALDARTIMAESSGAEVLVSIHTNGLPDGVNPFTNTGTSTYYFHPRSLPLARAINQRVVEAFGTRDLGVGRGDLRLVRPQWMLSVLVEGLFQMLPEHDAWLGTEQGRRRYGEAIVRGLEDFYRGIVTD